MPLSSSRTPCTIDPLAAYPHSVLNSRTLRILPDLSERPFSRPPVSWNAISGHRLKLAFTLNLVIEIGQVV